MNNEIEQAENRVNQHFKVYYNCTLDDVEITDTPGYWRLKQPCDPRKCRAPIHGFLFNEGRIHHTVTFFDRYPLKPQRKGTFFSPYATWRVLAQCAADKKKGEG